MTRLREAISSDEILVVLVRATGAADPPSVDPSLRLRSLTANDSSMYGRVFGTDSPRTFSARLSDETRCYVVEDTVGALHASWVTTACAWTREIRSFVCLREGDAYVYESFTRTEARGRGVYPFALVEICKELAARGIGRLWVAVEAHNEPSLRAVAKAGFVPSFEIGYSRKLGRLRVTLPDVVKADRRGTRGTKSPPIWLPGDGAIYPGKP